MAPTTIKRTKVLYKVPDIFAPF